MSRNKWILVLCILIVVALVAAVGYVWHGVLEAREREWESHCVARLIQIRFALQNCIDDGHVPVSSSATRRNGELDAIPALDGYLSQRDSLQCPAFVSRYPGEVSGGSYRIPDWTLAQWRRVRNSGGACSRPIAWDARPVHDGLRFVLFADGHIERGVAEDVFQQLRKASEEFVRDAAAEPKPVAPPE